MTRVLCTVVPVCENAKMNDLAGISAEWISGSPHNNIKKGDLAEVANDNFKYSEDGIEINTIRPELENDDIWALRLSQESKDGLYTSEIVGYKREDSFDVSVSLNYETKEPGKTQ